MLPSVWNRGGVSPFERLWDIHREMDRLFEPVETGERQQGTSPAWLPPMDVVETGDSLLCHIEVPGLSREDLDIRVEGNVVTITGEKRYQQDDGAKNGGFRHIERRYGRFERSFTIPQSVEAERVKAQYENGVLTVILPKAEKSKPRRIEIEGKSNQRQIEG